MKKQTKKRAPRFGAYVVTTRSAIHQDFVYRPDFSPTPQPSQHARPEPWQVLWSNHPLELPQGRALGVRKRADVVEVAWVPKSTLRLTWVAPTEALTRAQLNSWLSRTEFSP